MKKLMYILIILNIIVFSINTYISYSNQVPYNILKDKDQIQITKKDDMDSKDFIQELISISGEKKVDIMLRTIENPSKLKPTHIFYKTNNNKDFIDISIKDNSTLINENTYLSSEAKNDNSYQIVGSFLLNDVVVYDFSKLSEKNLDSNVYYIDKVNSSELMKSLQENGYTVSKLSDTENAFSEEAIFDLTQSIMLGFFFCSVMFYMFSRTKEIVIKKINGHGSANILLDELKSNILKFILIFIICQLLVTIFTLINYPYAVLDYLKYSYLRDIILMVTMIIIFIFNSIYIIIQKDYLSIKGASKDLVVMAISTIAKITVIILLIYNISGITFSINEQMGIMNNLKIVDDRINDYFSVKLNATNVDFEANYETYETRAKEFCKEMVKNYNTIICSEASSIIGDSILIVNDNYFKINPINTLDGTKITNENCNEYAFIPSSFTEADLSARYILEIIKNENIQEENILRYNNSNNSIYAYNANSEFEKGANIENAIIICKNTENILNFSSLSLLSGSEIVFEAHSENPYSEILPYLQEQELENVILEAKFITDMFSDTLEIQTIILYRYVGTAIIYFILLFILLGFETQVYYQNYKKRIAVKLLYGYGINTYVDAFIIRILSLILYCLVAIIFNFNLFVVVIIALLDIIIFISIMKRLVKNKIPVILKGDE